MGSLVQAPDQPKASFRPQPTRRRLHESAHRALKVAEVAARLAVLAKTAVEFFSWLF